MTYLEITFLRYALPFDENEELFEGIIDINEVCLIQKEEGYGILQIGSLVWNISTKSYEDIKEALKLKEAYPRKIE